jgi:hypothetical protein
MSGELACRDDRGRRAKVRAGPLNGLDYLEVSEDQQVLTVYFLGKAPEQVAKENVRIDGGRRIRGIRAVEAVVFPEDDPELDDALEVTVDRPGDDSTYTLSLVELNERGQQTDTPLEGFDGRYDKLPFSFKIGCPSDLDCKRDEVCPPLERAQPEIDYLAKDYASFRRLILDRLALIAPGRQERHVPDLGIALIELLAYSGDYLSYYQDAVATEAYLDTARRRVSIRRHARLVDYALHEGCNARAFVCVDTNTHLTLDPADVYFVTSLADASGVGISEDELAHVPRGRYEPFEPLPVTDRPIELFANHYEIPVYTWGDADCCLPVGATSATLTDEWETPPEKDDDSEPPSERERVLRLRAGDLLVFEEVKGPKSGRAPDADPSHRQAVLLTRVEHAEDELYDQPVVEVEWAAEDALRFPLCISSIDENCEPVDRVTVARGNVVPVDHGLHEPEEPLGQVPTIELPANCDCHGRPAEPFVVPGRFEPTLVAAPLTYAEPVGRLTSAAVLLEREPHQALPQVRLTATPPEPGRRPVDWLPASDLLSSGATDRAFVVEIDDDRHAHVRFGDGELGAGPEPGASFSASYRTGNGSAGNVGAAAIAHVVFRKEPVSGAGLRVRNPLAAQGGVEPEPLADAKLLAPFAFRAVLERAITADDYARIAERDKKLQRAAATLIWTGSWYEARVAVDPRGTEEVDPGLLGEVARSLRRFRRIGHDLAVVPAHYVSLDLALVICVLPHFLRGDVEAAVRDALGNRRLPNGRLGLFHPDNETFADAVSLSRIVAAVQAVEGVETVSVAKLQRLFEAPNGERESGLLRLGPGEIARLDDDPRFPEHGKLTLDLRGGR